MKKIFTIFFLCLATLAWSQTDIQVGDYVLVKHTATKWMTGETISTWVYDEPHVVSQVNSRFHPNGILLSVRGAKSWIDSSEVLLFSPSDKTNVNVEKVVYIYDTIVNVVEKVKEVIKIDTIKTVESVDIETSRKAAFQMDITMGVACGDINVAPNAHIVVGARLSNHVFIGGGIGFEGGLSYNEKRSPYVFQIPIYGAIRCYFPIGVVEPSIDLAAGINLRELSEVIQHDKAWLGELYTRAGLGLDYKRFTIGLGYQFSGGHTTISDNVHQAYFKVGVRFLDK